MSEAVIAIISYAPGGSRQTGLCQNAVTAYVNALKNLDKSIWSRENNIQKSYKKWLVSHIKSFHCAVYGSKNKGKKSKSEGIRIWRDESNNLFEILKKGVDARTFDEH